MNTISTDEFTDKLFRQQKRELAILNAIIQTVSSSYNLKETLESALEIILSVVGSETGWICLLDEHHSCSAFVGKIGLCFSNNKNGSTSCLVDCVCGRVQETKEVVIIRHLRKGCPLLVDPGTRQVVGHASVPLTTKSRVVGQLNVAFNDQQHADQMDIDLLKAIGPQLAVAVENARLWEDVQEKEALRKELLKKLVTAQEEERSRISRELHDELGQDLTSLLVRLQVLEKLGENPTSMEIIADLKISTTAMLSSIHDLALKLRPTVLDDLGLIPALAQYTRSCPDHMGIEVDFEVIGDEGKRLPSESETTLYRVIQESLTNVARHSKAKKASVMIKFTDQTVVAIIEDNGVGFDLDDVRTSQVKMKHLGLYGMEERIALVGGAITVETSPGAGTNIYVEVPIRHPVSPFSGNGSDLLGSG